jgi:RimJ/RimL family protein N-acetyltransferase
MIYGKRIRLRAIERTDLPKFVGWLNEPEVIENLEIHTPLSLAQEEDWFNKNLSLPGDEQVLAIDVKERSMYQMIGTLAFVKINLFDRSGEVGIAIGNKSYWNKGYGTEALQTLIRHGFETLGLNRIWLRVYETNARGIQAYKKAGFIHEGIMRQAHWKNGRFVDVHIMGVLVSEWKDKD